jgi:hypothetical protein
MLSSLGQVCPQGLVVDVIHQAVRALRAQWGTLGGPSMGKMSPWTRLLDHLAWEHGILFVVSAGNAGE